VTALKPRGRLSIHYPMRRYLPLLAVLAAVLVAPAASQAATPGVNIAQASELPYAQATGAKYVRIFAPRNAAMADPAAFHTMAVQARGMGMRVIFVLLGDAGGGMTPPDPTDFASFAGTFAGQMAGADVAAYEIWNEEDETIFWPGAPNAPQYAAVIRAAYPAIKAADPGAKVLLGPLTGNNYDYLNQLYSSGAGGYFDGVSVHTDTACLVDPPSSYYRDNGNVARFTFLGFRTVHDVMAAHGDGNKPIWMTEFGWTTATSTCTRGMWAGKKAAGVNEAQQAANLREAFHCLAGYPYVETALWFTLRDLASQGDELNHYGLERIDTSHKPSWDAFHSVATQGDTLTGACGDFDAPTLKVTSPGTNEQYVQVLTISAVATDPSNVARITFQADGKEIRNFTGADVGSGKTVKLEWQGAKGLSFGKHTITVLALDPMGNTSTQKVLVTRVKTLKATLKTKMKLGTVHVKGRKASISGKVAKTAAAGLSGKVRVYWQQKRKGKWKTIHGGLKPANKPFTFRQKLKGAGTWRAKIKYVNVAPYKSSTATSKPFRVH
jgi:Bacterial Ig domain